MNPIFLIVRQRSLLTALTAAALFIKVSLGVEAAETNISPLPSPGKANLRHALLFRNGDLVYGELESIKPDTGIRWRHSDVEKPIEFKPDNAIEIHFAPRPKASSGGTNQCHLRLSNGDELEGRLLELNQTNALLQTWYAGEISIPRNRLGDLIPIPPEGEIIFRGPTGLEDWIVGKVVAPGASVGEWKYRNGAFYATNAASIARDVKLPDVAVIEFDLAWKGLFQLAVALYTDYFQPINLANKDSEPDFGGFYSLQLNSFSANLLPVKKNDPLRFLGQISVPVFNQKNAAHIEIRASKPKRTISLLVDGELLKQWSETEEFSGEGTGMRFVNQGTSKVKLSHFQISHWDGQFVERSSTNAPQNQDLAKLRNGDKVGGEVRSYHDGTVTIATGSNQLDIPLNRVKQIEFARQKMVSAADHANIRAIFAQGGAVSFELEKWESGKVFGTSPNYGRLTLDPTAFSRLELNLNTFTDQPSKN